MRRIKVFLVAVVLPTLILAGSNSVAFAQIIFTFDPVQVFSYQDVSGGTLSKAGGMFQLDQSYDNGPSYPSWNVAGRSTVDQLKNGLGPNQGIGAFDIDLYPTGSANATGLAEWGQTLTGSASSSISAATVPSGWSYQINTRADGGGTDYQAFFSTTDPTKYIRPGNDPGNFSFTLTNVSGATPGTNYVFWLGEWNNGDPLIPSTEPALVYTTPSPGAGTDSGFEATLSITATPEPGTTALCAAGFGFAVAIAAWRRSRKAG
ncbi:MAG: PEP-CTERM sorting domain-containing protein [Thermoguttaceae bacterium]